jgi:hypothetical protein
MPNSSQNAELAGEKVHCESTFRPLEFPFKRKGWQYDLLERDGLVCLVKRSRYGIVVFEVVKLKLKPAWETPKGYTVPASEIYPTNVDWGLYGFTYRSLSDPDPSGWTARKRFEWMAGCQERPVSNPPRRTTARFAWSPL